MAEPELYHSYTRDEAIRLFGNPKSAREQCGGEFVIFREASLCFTKIRKRPDVSGYRNNIRHSHFYDASRFVWAGKGIDPDGRKVSVPEEVLRRTPCPRPMYLFVRTNRSRRFLYVGVFSTFPCGCGRAGRTRMNAAFRDLAPPRATGIWNQLHSIQAKAKGAERGMLKLAGATPRKKFNCLKRFVEDWHGPFEPKHGMSPAELKGYQMPDVLRWWYALAGRREDILSGQNGLMCPKDLECDGKKLIFYREREGVYAWATQVEGIDPPVYVRDPDDWGPWDQEKIYLSEFLLQVCIYETSMRCSYRITSWPGKETARLVARHLDKVPLGPWEWTYQCHFYVGKGVIAMIGPGILEMGAREQESLAPFKDLSAAFCGEDL